MSQINRLVSSARFKKIHLLNLGCGILQHGVS
jgi:hypothetical protein